MTILELKKELIKAKKEKNKIKVNSLIMIIDTIEKIAKEKNEEISEKHIIKGIKKYLKQLEDAKASFMPVEDELKFVKGLADKILPKELSEKETEKIIKNLIEKYGDSIGVIMKELKKYNVNMKKANEMVKNIIKKEK
jgi:uncharacterized protein YqeY